jgi:hypothetical protein
MSDLTRFHKVTLPRYFWILSAIAVALAATICVLGIYSWCTKKAILSGTQICELGQQGDFFGGHFSAIVGLITLLLVGAGVLIERQESRRYALREQFAEGLKLIVDSFKAPIESKSADRASESYAIPSILTYRLVNYYSRLALAHKDDKELLIILNVPITGKLRTELEDMCSEKECSYPFACEALLEFKKYEREMHLSRKGIKGY